MNHLSEYLFFGLYVIAGPLVSVGFGIALIKGRKRMLLVQRPAIELPEQKPRVSILIPARNEGERIGDCLRSAVGQEYPDFEVIAVDDRSTDETGRVMDQLAQEDGLLKVIHITDERPPEGWTGKCNALNRGVAEASGDWLLFIDSDVVVERDALSATLAFALKKEVDLVSLMPRAECHSLWERLLVPLAGCALGAMHLVAITNNDHRRGIAFANGQYMLFRREVYEAIGGHRAVRDRLCEDMGFARLVKGQGHRIRILWGEHLAAVRMYRSLESIRRGWARIFFAAGMGSPWRIWMAIMFAVLCCYSGYAALAWGIYRNTAPINVFAGWGWIAAAVVHLGVLTVFLGTMYGWSGNRRRNALWLPLSAAMLLGIFGKALRMCSTGKVEWRGMQYQDRQREWAVEGTPIGKPD